MMPTFTELQYFIEVSKSLNLSRASEILGISQPSLSLAIKRLERSVGTELLIRHQHGVALTQSGKQLLAHAKKLLNYWQDTRALTLASKVEVQGSYTLGCHPTVAIDIVSGFLPNLLETYPKLEIHLKNDLSRRILEQIIDFKIDIGILVNPVKHPDLIISKLCNDEMTFWSITKKRKIHDVYSGEAIVLCDPDLQQTQTLLTKGRDQGFIFDRIITMNSLEVVASMTANGCGIGILPTLMTNTLYPKKLKQIIDAPVYSEELCLVYRNEIRSIQAIQTITTAIKNYCNK
ncbi:MULTISPECIES: LysR family transcriptional regulator [Legionella]|uniref:LysR family transcriptional regulator n=1 Tax=Legionella resiliens TaxID=2905958 RepID=A0ABS8X139_9GAMM|nr:MULTISPECIES: LysR family transcriptional regulator [unclassified Legionella]MCE0721858.1 LysR family transcriptional regulator [Legionella sp. 9fVS26]MCE3531012.1 LysR family transcriptional regulator [Legionella sp. 8cVS16]QLZ70574.1 LysR family transcriptional regulator [Legionella sp. PC1000]